MTSAPQLMDTPAHDLPLETPPTRLTRRVGLIGFEQTTRFMCANPGQQHLGMIGGLGGHEHCADQRQRTRGRPSASLPEIDLEFPDAAATTDDRCMRDPATDRVVPHG